MNDLTTFLSPVGRLIAGDCFTPNDKDNEGKPLLIKNGPNIGQARVEYYVGLAISKQDPAWQDFYTIIYQKARDSFPAMFDATGACIVPTFAFKVIDGDSQIPNTKGKKPCDRPEWAGCWIVSFANGFAPSVLTKGGASVITDTDAVKRGYYVRVSGTVKGNGSQQQPGVFLNFNMVELIGYGEILQTGPDPLEVFGENAPTYTPAGMTDAPQTSAPGPMAAPPAASSPAPNMPPASGLPAPGPTMTPPAASSPALNGAPAAGPVTPAHDFVNKPGAPGGGGPPPVAPAQTVPIMTASANGTSYEEMLKLGWTHETMLEHGHIQA